VSRYIINVKIFDASPTEPERPCGQSLNGGLLEVCLACDPTLQSAESSERDSMRILPCTRVRLRLYGLAGGEFDDFCCELICVAEHALAAYHASSIARCQRRSRAVTYQSTSARSLGEIERGYDNMQKPDRLFLQRIRSERMALP